MSTITAGLGLSQFSKIKNVIEKRRKNAQYLTLKLSKIKGIKTPLDYENRFNVYQMYVIQVNEGKEVRDSLLKYLLD